MIIVVRNQTERSAGKRFIKNTLADKSKMCSKIMVRKEARFRREAIKISRANLETKSRETKNGIKTRISSAEK